MITATLHLFGQKFIGRGETISEAIANIQPGITKGRGVLAVEQNGVTRERIIMPIMLGRLYNASGTMREIALKQISTLF